MIIPARATRMSLRMLLLITGSTLAATAASAQSGGPGPSPSTAPGTTSGETDATTRAGGVEEIVVTAQRRNERLQDVPIAITAVTAAAAARQGITGTEGLGVAVPTLQFSRQTANGGAPFLRGVGSPSATAGQEAPVAVYIDDVYIGAPSATLFQFNNIESTEVLKGPQGTLFGRNATGGVVNVHTRKPSQEASLDATAGFGSYNTYYGSAYVNAPLTSDLAANFAIAGKDQTKGYGRSIARNDDIYKSKSWGARGQLGWDPDADTSVLLAADYFYSRGDIGQNVVLAPGTVATGGGTFVDRYSSLSDPADFGVTHSWGVSGKLEHSFGDYTFRSITAYRESDLEFLLDADGSLPGRPALISSHVFDAFVNSFSQEVQLLSPTAGNFRWILGAFYYNSFAGYAPVTTSGAAFATQGFVTGVDSRQNLNSYSGFGEASWEFLPETKLTAGLRYTSDRYRMRARVFNGLSAALPPSPFEQRDNFDKLTYRAILDTKLARDVLLYASYSRGFKSGGYNLSTPTAVVGTTTVPAEVVRPEVLDAYEIGLKSDLFDRKVRFNIALYHYDYSNLQIGRVTNGRVQTVNAAKARMNGIDIDYSFVPSARFNFGGGVSILDAKFTSFPNGPLYVPSPAICTPTPQVSGPLTGGNTVCSADLAGKRTTRAPTLTFTASATYTLPTTAGDFLLNGTLYHNSGFFWEPDNRLQQPRYDLVNASLGWIAPDKKYEVKLYGKNLLNQYYLAYASESTTRDSFSPEMPRNYGVELTVHF